MVVIVTYRNNAAQECLCEACGKPDDISCVPAIRETLERLGPCLPLALADIASTK